MALVHFQRYWLLIEDSLYFTFLDNSLLLQIKTNCSQHSQSKYEKTFTFCQNGKCCSTGALPPQECENNDYGFGTDYKLGECSKFDFRFENVEGNVIYHNLTSATDGWTPEWIELNLGEAPFPRLSINGAVIKCSFDGRIIGSVSDKAMTFDCKPEGKRFFLGF